MGKKLDLVGHQYGRLTVTRYLVNDGAHRVFECQCECGNITRSRLGDLRMGKRKSCGCLQKTMRKTYRHKHGRTNTKEYRSWAAMRRRCYRKEDSHYYAYGGRGISVCEKWRSSFESFYADMGPAPSPKHSIDRINNDGNYEPGNCRWATLLEQARNRRKKKATET